MPVENEIKKACEIKNVSPNQRWEKYIYRLCPICKEGRWVRLYYFKKGKQIKCQKCNRITEHTPSWKGGRTQTGEGYIAIRNNEYPSMLDHQGYILEHRLVIARKINRALLPHEHVHHVNGIKTDNRPENLELISRENHNIRSQLCSQCGLRKEIKLLQWQIKELSKQLQAKMEVLG